MIADRAGRPVQSTGRKASRAKRKQSTCERLLSGKMNRKQRRELTRRLCSDDPGLEIVHQQVAGIDIGNESHMWLCHDFDTLNWPTSILQSGPL